MSLSQKFCVGEKKFESVPKPARRRGLGRNAGGKSAEAWRIHSPRQIVSPCLVRISIFNHLDFARNSFELCPTNTDRSPEFKTHFPVRLIVK